MTRHVVFVCATAAMLACARPGLAQTGSTDIDALLKRIRVADAGQLAVSEEDGRFLRVLVASSRKKRALEIGAASGYSGIWIGLGLRVTGGQLTSIEYDPIRAREAIGNLKRAGLADIVRVIPGDAFVEVPKLSGTFDFVFLDAWKRDYKRFFDLLISRLEPGGLFIAHNVVNKRDEMEDFLLAIDKHPALWNTVVSPSGEGMSISYRKR
jgi:predicted O-methyltransferase YrrM